MPASCVPAVWAVASALAAGPSAAPAEPVPGHSVHGEAFDHGPRQAATRIRGTGGVHLPVTTAAPEAQAFVDQGVGQLHGFWYYEAERSFRQAAALDPGCAMAYWGVAMANWNNPKRAKGFIEKAVANKAKASPRERQWVAAYAAFWTGTKDESDRRRDLAAALEAIALEYPEELEARAFLLFHLWDSSSRGVPLGSKLAADALARQVLAEAPAHPAHHYVIHLWDGGRAERALASAARCGPAAPGIAHMWHMPGHTYSKLRRYADAAWQQEASARVDHFAAARSRLIPDQIHNYAHNNQWLAESLGHVGRAKEAVARAADLVRLPRHPKYNALGADGPKDGSAAHGRRRLFELLARYELWDDLIARAATPDLEPTDVPAEQVKRLRMLGVAHFASGNAAAGRDQIRALEARLADLKAQRVTAADEAEAKAKQDKKSAADAAKAMAEAIQKVGDRRPPIEAALAELRVWDALATGDKPKAKALLEKATDIARDRTARLWLQAGDADRAVKLARSAAAGGENQVPPLATYVDILWQAGKQTEAKAEFAKLRTVAADADLDAPVMKRLAPVAAALGLPADWRLPRTAPADLGPRSTLADLGPVAWEPWAAPDWTARGPDGRAVGAADYRGKPVVVICHLGFGCTHCVEQLAAFGPVAALFRAAGLDLVAIGSEAAEPSAPSAGAKKLGPDFPFPLLADPSHAAFRAFGAYDDFETQPLHGTYLIDAAGRVRWLDVGPDPFTDAAFLLGEAKRLLAPTGGPAPATTTAGRPAAPSSTPQ